MDLKGHRMIEYNGSLEQWCVVISGLVALIIINILFEQFKESDESKEKRDICLYLITNGFNKEFLDSLKEVLEICLSNAPKRYHIYVTNNLGKLDFIFKYPKIFEKASSGKKYFEGKKINKSKDIFDDLFHIGINSCDIMNKSVLNALDTALLVTDEGKHDLVKGGFHFDELMKKASFVKSLITKLEGSKEYKKYFLDNKNFKT
jgi:hypothetical protein